MCAVITLFFVLAAQVGDLGHLLLVEHQRCQHGEIIHAESHHEDHSSVRANQDAEPEGTALEADDTHGGDHEHCTGVAVFMLSEPPALAALEHVIDISELQALCPRDHIASRLYQLAPKNSPPV